MATDIDRINKNLARLYGKLPDNRPIFRVSWTTGQMENRWGTFAQYLPGTQIYVGEFTGMRVCQKYGWLPDRWVLEKLTTAPRLAFPDHDKLLGQDLTGSYEAIWSFQTKEGEYQKPIWKGVDFIVRTVLYPEQMGKVHKTPGGLESDRIAEEQKEMDDFDQILDLRMRSPIGSALHDGDAVGYTGGIITPADGFGPLNKPVGIGVENA